MPKGRKPKKNAIRRASSRPVPVEATVVEASGAPVVGVPKTDFIESHQFLSETFDSIVGEGMGLDVQDASIVEQYVFWAAIVRQLQEQMVRNGGGSSIETLDTVYDREGREGVESSVLFKQYKEACDQFRKYADMLGGTPIARTRLGIAKGVEESITNSIRDSIVAAVEQMGL